MNFQLRDVDEECSIMFYKHKFHNKIHYGLDFAYDLQVLYIQSWQLVCRRLRFNVLVYLIDTSRCWSWCERQYNICQHLVYYCGQFCGHRDVWFVEVLYCAIMKTEVTVYCNVGEIWTKHNDSELKFCYQMYDCVYDFLFKFSLCLIIRGMIVMCLRLYSI